MAWSVDYTKTARGQLDKLPRAVAGRIMSYLEDRVAVAPGSPRQYGEALRGPLSKFWKYRVGEYRIICELHDDSLVILAVKIGHRREVYKRK